MTHMLEQHLQWWASHFRVLLCELLNFLTIWTKLQLFCDQPVSLKAEQMFCVGCWDVTMLWRAVHSDKKDVSWFWPKSHQRLHSTDTVSTTERDELFLIKFFHNTRTTWPLSLFYMTRFLNMTTETEQNLTHYLRWPLPKCFSIILKVMLSISSILALWPQSRGGQYHKM